MTLSGDAQALSTGLFDITTACGAVTYSARAAMGEQRGSAPEAVRAAAADPRRAAVLLHPEELADALPAIAEAAAAHVPLVAHVPFLPEHDCSAIAPLCETGAAVLSTWASKEAVGAAVALHRAAQDSEMPFVHLHDAAEGAVLDTKVDQAAVEAILGVMRPRAAAGVAPDRARVRSFATRVPFALAGALRAAGERLDVAFPLLERFETADADEVVVTFGRTFGIARTVAHAMRSAGRKVGVLGVRALRPFLAADVVKAISRAKAAVVIEPLDPALDPTGPLAQCVKGAFFDALTWAPGFPGVGRVPPIVSVTSATPSLRPADVEAALSELLGGERARRTVVIGSE